MKAAALLFSTQVTCLGGRGICGPVLVGKGCEPGLLASATEGQESWLVCYLVSLCVRVCACVSWWVPVPFVQEHPLLFFSIRV